jgi:hypothetical protein
VDVCLGVRESGSVLRITVENVEDHRQMCMHEFVIRRVVGSGLGEGPLPDFSQCMILTTSRDPLLDGILHSIPDKRKNSEEWDCT